jgi:hypothetical protein
MKHKISFLSYIGMLGMPALLGLLVIAYIIKMPAAIQTLKVVLALAAIGYSVTGIYEVFVNGKK